MRKRFSLGTKTVEVSFKSSISSSDSSQDIESQELKCDCSWGGKVENLTQRVNAKKVDLQCPSCEATLAEVVYTHLDKGGSDARLASRLEGSEFDDDGRTHVSSKSPQYLQ